MTPLLILVFGVHPATAVGTDLLYTSITKTAGTLVHGLNQTVRWRIVALLAAGSVPATALTLLVISKVELSGGVASGVISVCSGFCYCLRRFRCSSAGSSLSLQAPDCSQSNRSRRHC